LYNGCLKGKWLPAGQGPLQRKEISFFVFSEVGASPPQSTSDVPRLKGLAEDNEEQPAANSDDEKKDAAPRSALPSLPFPLFHFL
jgi:hypothetical protein